MKLLIVLVVLCLGVVTVAARPVSTEVVQKLKELEPVYKQLQDKVISEVAGAKLATATATDTFYKGVIADKETSLTRSIQLEDDMTYQFNGQASSVDASCLQMLRSIVDMNMNVAGFGYTNCVNNVEAGVKAELDRVYQLLQVDESELFDISLLDVFKGENIISNPAKIIAKLTEKRSEIDGISLSFVADINAAVNAYSSRLGDMQNEYKTCLLGNESVLKGSFESTKNQLVQTCLGAIV
ncbi:AGAP008579-PA [Anopheles gambiae str. PEST]|uniref:AGAP008579-PA n=1 Tax=Anopheles gambiae TaxID=7165 RepID=A7UTG2_ANOGA|nr:AGAP008579-PA [Anopheles gambiae str. PEST]